MYKSISAMLVAAAIATAQQTPPEPTFRTGTELVQVSVIAQDKQSKPVTDLRRDEFQIFDNGAAQELRLFQVETEESGIGISPVNAPNTFSNRIAPQTGSHSGYSVILIDNLYTDFGDPFTESGSGAARLQTLQTLRSIPAGERIAIYAQGRKLQVICEFTSDRDLLERQLEKWRPQVDTPDISTDALHLPSGPLDTPEMKRSREAARTEGTRLDMTGRVSAGNEEMELVADHLAGIPGRKKLIWLSNKFIVGPRALQKLNAAGVSIYPVDIDAVCGYFQACLYRPRPTELMDGIAALTGGVAYYLRNDVDVAIREAIDDGRVSYTLGFYPSEGDRGAPMHQLMVKVSRPDVGLRYRTSYQAEAPPAAQATKTELAQALNRPIDATAIPVTASVRRVRDRLNLEATLDVESLGLVPDHELWTGKLKVAARFTTADGAAAGDAFAQTVNLNLHQATYEKATRGGLTYHNELKIPAGAVELKLLFANPASGKIGTLTIPISEIDGDAAHAR